MQQTGNNLAEDLLWKCLFENSPDTIIVLEPNTGTILAINSATDERTKKILIGSSAYSYIEKEYHASYKQALETVANTGKTQTIELEGLGKNGSKARYRSFIMPFICNGKADKVIVQTHDITQEHDAAKKAKDEILKRSLVLSQMPAMVWTVDNNLIITSSEGSGLKNIGVKPGELVGTHLYDYLGTDDPESLAVKTHLGALKGEEYNYQQEFLNRHFHTHMQPFKDEKGNIQGAIGFAIDITEQQKLQQNIKKIEDEYRSLLESSHEGIFIHDSKGKVLVANKSALDVLKIKSLDELNPNNLFHYILPQYHDMIRQRKALIENGESLPVIKCGILRPNGEKIEVETKAIPIKFRGEKAIMIVYHELSLEQRLQEEKEKLKQAESLNRRLQEEIKAKELAHKELQQSRETILHQAAKLKAIFNDGTHMVYTINKKHQLTSFNERYAQSVKGLYGIDVYEGMDVKEVSNGHMPEEQIRAFMEQHTEVLRSKQTHRFEMPASNPEGKTIWLEMVLNPIQTPQGQPEEVAYMVHDITAAKQSQMRIERSLKEKEVLIKEVHHRVKNNLQVISSIFSLQTTFTKDKKTIALMRESQNRLKTMAYIHESLYQNKDLSRIDFGQYLSVLCNNLALSYGQESENVALDISAPNISLSLDQSISCGLLVNELVSNAYKYAFKQQKKKKDSAITVKAARRGDTISLSVADNGTGIPSGFDFRNSQTLGLQLVLSLAEQLDGKIKLDSKKGTKFTLTFKIQHDAKS